MTIFKFVLTEIFKFLAYVGCAFVFHGLVRFCTATTYVLKAKVRRCIFELNEAINARQLKESFAAAHSKLQDDANAYNDIRSNAPGWVAFIETMYVGEKDIMNRIFQVDINAIDINWQLRCIAGELFREVIHTTWRNTRLYHDNILSSANDQTPETIDDLSQHCDLFRSITRELAEKAQSSVDEFLEDVQTIDYMRRETSELEAARLDLRIRQTRVKEQERLFLARWNQIQDETQIRVFQEQGEVYQKLCDLHVGKKECFDRLGLEMDKTDGNAGTGEGESGDSSAVPSQIETVKEE